MKYEVVSKNYLSNCLIEAIKAKLRHPKTVKLYFCKPKWGIHFQNLHVMWDDGEYSYDFSDTLDTQLLWWECFLYLGHIRKFKQGTSERYSKFRNRRKSNEKGKSYDKNVK